MDEFKPKRKMKTVVYQMYVCLYNGGCGNCWHNDRPDCCRQLLMKDALYYLQQTLEKSEKKRSVKMENKFGRYAETVERIEKIKKGELPRYHGFEFALSRVKSGARMARFGWNGKDQYIELAENVEWTSPSGETLACKDAIAFHGTSGLQIGWLASQADMLANDWMEIE